jgi:hypothetical protein
MPIHDWTRVPSALFHHFHQDWSIEIARRLNRGVLPRGLSALVQQRYGVREADVLTVETRPKVRHHLGRIVAVIEIVSPGNKDSRAALRDFVDKAIDFLREGVHLLIVDLFPPTPRDPLGIHKVLWDEILEGPFVFPEGKDRILASYETGGERAAYVEPVAVGDVMPDMPLFLAEGMHVPVPLESTYCATWAATPEELRLAVETGVLPDPDAE